MHPPTIGKYRIIRTLGEGGMGTVYEAEQDQPHRMVALKVIRPAFASADLTRRFARESEALGRLQHPGIAQIYEAGTAEGERGPQSYFAMELIRGHALNEHVALRSPTLAERLELFARICDAVHYAHRQGVIHRDLKPANIVVDTQGQPKILDFGVARLTDSDVQATRQTTVGEVVGTLQYMSPEQVNADPSDLDVRSDVYSLGVILYELVSGRLPYDLSKSMIYEAARVILVEDPAPLRSHDRRLARDVEIIVAKTLAKEKELRYPSAEELASDVRRYLRDEPIVARPASAIYHLRKFARRNRALVGGLALAAGILVVGTAVSVWQAVRATAAERLAESRRNEAVSAGALAERRRAVADSALVVADSARAAAQRERAAAIESAERARGEAAKAQAINGFLQDMLASSDPANAQGKEPTVRELLDRAAGSGPGSLARQPEVNAAVQTTIGRTYFALGLYDQARHHLDSAYAIRRRLGGGLPLGQSADDLGKLAQAAGDYPLAEQRLEEALATLRSRVAPNDDQVTSAMETLADARYSRGDFAGAEKLYRQALTLTKSRHGKDGTQVADRLEALGTFLGYNGRADEAEPLLVEAVAVVRRAFGDNHPRVVSALVGLSDVQLNRPDNPAAEKAIREAMAIAHRVFGAEHPMIANVSARLATTLTNQNKMTEAEPFARDALAMRIKLLGEQHPDVQLARVELGRLLQFQGRYPEADTLFTQALAARRAVLGDTSPAVAASLEDLGYLATAREDWAGAAARYRDALAIWRTAKIEDMELNATAALGWALVQESKLDEAEALLTGVLSRRRALLGEQHWSVGDTYEKIAGIAFKRGQVARAESLSVAGLAIRRAVYGENSPQAANQLTNIAFLKEVRGDTAGAVPILQESLRIVEQAGPSTPSTLAGQQRLGVDLCAVNRAAQGDSLLRVALAHAPADSTLTMPHQLRAALGFCLTRLERFAEAERLLLQAEARLAALPPSTGRRYQLDAGRFLAELYRRWGKAAEAEVWNAKTKSP